MGGGVCERAAAGVRGVGGPRGHRGVRAVSRVRDQPSDRLCVAAAAVAGEESFEDRSHRPHISPRRLEAAAEAAILAVRDAHPAWGARKIAAVLAAEARRLRRSRRCTRCCGGTGGSRRRNGADPWGGSSGESPNALWQMDFKGRVRLACGTLCHPLTIVDDHSRYALGLFACADERTATVRLGLRRSSAAMACRRRSMWTTARPGAAGARTMDPAAALAAEARHRNDPCPPVTIPRGAARTSGSTAP